MTDILRVHFRIVMVTLLTPLPPSSALSFVLCPSGNKIHTGCADRMKDAKCSLGRHRRLILPPMAVVKNQPLRRGKGQCFLNSSWRIHIFSSPFACFGVEGSHYSQRLRSKLKVQWDQIMREESSTTASPSPSPSSRSVPSTPSIVERIRDAVHKVCSVLPGTRDDSAYDPSIPPAEGNSDGKELLPRPAGDFFTGSGVPTVNAQRLVEAVRDAATAEGSRRLAEAVLEAIPTRLRENDPFEGAEANAYGDDSIGTGGIDELWDEALGGISPERLAVAEATAGSMVVQGGVLREGTGDKANNDSMRSSEGVSRPRVSGFVCDGVWEKALSSTSSSVTENDSEASLPGSYAVVENERASVAPVANMICEPETKRKATEGGRFQQAPIGSSLERDQEEAGKGTDSSPAYRKVSTINDEQPPLPATPLGATEEYLSGLSARSAESTREVDQYPNAEKGPGGIAAMPLSAYVNTSNELRPPSGGDNDPLAPVERLQVIGQPQTVGPNLTSEFVQGMEATSVRGGEHVVSTTEIIDLGGACNDTSGQPGGQPGKREEVADEDEENKEWVVKVHELVPKYQTR